LHYALNRPDYKDELVAFLDASYFRAPWAVGQPLRLVRGGLAIDTIGRQGEEFSDFVEFWVERPAPGARSLVIHALLDSPGWPAPIDSRFDLETTPWST